jgi:cell division protein FtsB
MTPRGRRTVLIAALAVVTLVIYGFFVFPLRTILELQAREHAIRDQLAAVRRENASLAAEQRLLESVAYQEHLAEQDYGMVPRGTVPVQVLPSSPLYRPLDPLPLPRRRTAHHTNR